MIKRHLIWLLFFCFLLCIPFASAFPPFVPDTNPDNGETDVHYGMNTQVCAYIDLPSSPVCNATFYFYTNASGAWVEIGNGTTHVKGWNCSENFTTVCGTTYWWNISVYFDCYGFWENTTFIFTTTDCPVSHVSPVNQSEDWCPCCLTLCAKMTNMSGPMIKFEFQSNYTGVWAKLEETRIAPANQTYCMLVPEFVWYNYTYYWRVVYNDGGGAEASDIYHFTTAKNYSICEPITMSTEMEIVSDPAGSAGVFLFFIFTLASFIILMLKFTNVLKLSTFYDKEWTIVLFVAELISFMFVLFFTLSNAASDPEFVTYLWGHVVMLIVITILFVIEALMWFFLLIPRDPRSIKPGDRGRLFIDRRQ